MSVFADGSGIIDFHVESADRSGWEISLRLRGDGRDVTFRHLTKADVQELKRACADFQKQARAMGAGA